MFGMANTSDLPIDLAPPLPTIISPLPPPLNDVGFQGDQIRGFGYLHSGEIDTVFRFMGFDAFAQRAMGNPGGIPLNDDGIALRRALEAFVLAFDSNLAPIVGQQITLTARNASSVAQRIELLLQRAAADECQVVVRARLRGRERGFLYDPSSRSFAPDRSRDALLALPELRALARLTPLTFTAVPLGSGERIALDRDHDGVLDGDE